MYKTITLTTTQTIIENGIEKKIITTAEHLVETTPEEVMYDEMKAMHTEMVQLRKNLESLPVDSYDRRRLAELAESAKERIDSLYVNNGKVYRVMGREPESISYIDTKRSSVTRDYNSFINKYEYVMGTREVREALKK